MQLSVAPDQSVTVLAPLNATVERVERMLMRKRRWIRSQQVQTRAASDDLLELDHRI
jgi:predicted metal-dependent hydrolase